MLALAVFLFIIFFTEGALKNGGPLTSTLKDVAQQKRVHPVWDGPRINLASTYCNYTTPL
jgi:hypothetical protein